MDKLMLSIFLCLFVIAVATAQPMEHKDGFREKRDVLDSVKDASSDVAKKLTNAGDAVVDALTPTEKSVLDKIADGIKSK